MKRNGASTISLLGVVLGLACAAPALAVDDLSLNVDPGSLTVFPGNTVTVTLDVANLSAAINGVQIRIQYNTALMTLVDVVPNGTPGWGEIAQTDTAGAVDWAASINAGSTSADGLVATLTFTAIAEGTTSVTFRADADPFYTKLTRASDSATILPNKTNSGSITLSCDDGNPCTTDTVVSQVCNYTAAPNTTLCRASTDECDPAEFCDGVTTVCPGDSFTPDNTACTDDGLGCTNDICTTGVCSHPTRPNGFVCRASIGECDVQETCDGVATSCPTDVFVAINTQCTDSSPGNCDDARCDGAGACVQTQGVESNGYICRADNLGGCDAAETCNGVSGGACPADIGVANGTTCRASIGECDVAETCDGSSAPCPGDGFIALGTQCTDTTPGDCDDAQCNGGGACVQTQGIESNGYICRTDNLGGCDVAETCNGVSGGACPTDVGVANGTTCRSAVGECDVAETCDGSSAACPVDAFVAGGTQCTDSTPGDCDDAQCDGSGACDQLFGIELIGYICRADNLGGCDVAEACDGVLGGACPADVGVANGTTCRASIGECDVAETCDGSSTPCPVDAFVSAGTTCTDSTPGDCDEAQCNGSGACDQAFAIEASGYVCRANNGGGCDVQETCDGIVGGLCPADAGVPNGTVCRASLGECDVQETCNGTSAPCPGDTVIPAGTQCTDSNLFDCDDAQCDGAGLCNQAFDVESNGYVCRASTDECDPLEACDGVSGGACPSDAFLPDSTACTADSDACTADECLSGVCSHPDVTPAGQCCDPVLGGLTTIDDADPCTVDVCNGDGTVDHNPGGQVDASIKLQAVNAAVTRDVTFVITTCGGAVDSRTVPVSFNAFGNGVANLANVDAAADWIAISEGHTLRRLEPVSFVGCVATVDVSGANFLVSGDFHTGTVPQDNLVDIVDFSILASRWNQAISANASDGADATGNGVQNTGDFTAIQANFFLVGEAPDGCPLLAYDDPNGATRRPGGMEDLERIDVEAIRGVRSRVAVDRRFFPETFYADIDGDGFVDARDVRLFAAKHRIRLEPGFDRTLRQLERADRDVRGGR